MFNDKIVSNDLRCFSVVSLSYSKEIFLELANTVLSVPLPNKSKYKYLGNIRAVVAFSKILVEPFVVHRATSLSAPIATKELIFQPKGFSLFYNHNGMVSAAETEVEWAVSWKFI